MYDNVPVAGWIAICYVTIILAAIAWWIWFRPHTEWWQRRIERMAERKNMSTSTPPPVRESVPEAVHVPVEPTSTAAAPAEPAKPVPAGTDAPNGGTGWELPRVSRTLSDRDIIITLAVQRAGGKYRFSANQIHGLAGGPRGDVLALVKLVREGPAEHRPLSPEQQAARTALGLDRQTS
jgi:hypothetical protein